MQIKELSQTLRSVRENQPSVSLVEAQNQAITFNLFERLYIYGFKEVEEACRKNPNYWNIISISSKIDGWPELSAKNLVRLNFDDITNNTPSMFGGKYKLPSKPEIKKGLNFAKKHLNKPLIIHCAAGISRSAAMAFLIGLSHFKDVNKTFDWILLRKKSVYPNRLVLKLGCEILFKKDDEKYYKEIMSHDFWIFQGITI